MKNSLNIPFARHATALALMAAMLSPLAAQAFVLSTPDLPFSVTNWLPGNSATGTISVTNSSGPAQKAGIQIASTTGDFALFAGHVEYRITGPGGFDKNGDLSTLIGWTDLTTIPDGATHDFTFTLTFDPNAPQVPLMGKSFGFDIVIGLEDGTISPPVSVFSGGGSSGSRRAPIARVLGASTDTCEQLLYTYIHPNRQNDSAEVEKLQAFLRDLEGHHDLQVTGVYDAATQQAVHEFQQKYSDRVLRPWGLPMPTRFVYYTTRKMVNEIYCQFTREFPLTEAQQAEIAWYREQGVAYRQGSAGSAAASGSGLVEGVTSTVSTAVEEAVSTVGEQVAAAAAAGTGFWGKVVNFFKNLFSR